MRLLSVVGLKTGDGRRATLVHSSYSTSRRLSRIGRRVKISLFLATLFLAIFLQVKQYSVAVRVQESMVNFVAPVTEILAKPYGWMMSIGDFFRSHSDLMMENQSLKLQNDFLVRHNHNHSQVHSENLKLKDALNVKSVVMEDIVTARITHHVYDGYSATYFIAATIADGVKKNNPILTTSGYLLGRVLSVGEKNTRFMPITDVSSRVPVQIGSSADHAILAGTGKGEFILSHIENTASIRVGDELVTSGVGGVFAPGIPVAVVKSIEGTKVTATSLATIKDLDFVLVISQYQEDTE
ncbi:rod shape-determining protein MreC [Candidatus Paracaedibacter symbiosus]|uniref:rod shape-determining protein MreC n=1 Tax=Candidatus Paracaedibacter symbiosus TaxID=244582 RepID=UPI00068B9B0F|nr:rod shape-determining protein MreC [Candidatus Paracaedibacter symbiosus]